MMQTNFAWPPIYKIKKHRLARRVKLRASKIKGLEITVPYRFNMKEIPDILEQHKKWITKQLMHFQAIESDVLPEQIFLTAMQETWRVEYIESKVKLQIISRPQSEIVLVGDVQDRARCRIKLKAWIRAKAEAYLIAQMQILSERTKLGYANISIRSQQTLWGSCTAKKVINLNYKLIFLPANLVTHILIHELCHTRYLNHSKKFWELVAKLDVDCDAHRLAMRKAEQFIPAWVDI